MMRIETVDEQIVLKEVYNTIVLETREGKKLHVCMRDDGFEMRVDDGNWYMVSDDSDFHQPKKGFQYREPDYK